MKRYLWVLLLAACTAPTGEVTKAVKANTETKELLQTNNTRGTELSETETKKPDPEKVKPEITDPETTDNSKKTVEKKTLTGTYFGIRNLDILKEINTGDSEDEDSIPNDRRLALVFDADGKAGWGDADDESTAKTKANKKEYTYDVNGDTVTVKQKNGTTLLVLKLQDNNQFIYITEDNTNKIPQLNAGVKYENTGLALNGVEVQSGHGSRDLANRVNPPIPPFKKNKF